MHIKIKKYRKTAGLTQAELGIMIWENISPAAAQNRIRRIESDEKTVTTNDLEKISRILNIPDNATNKAIEEFLYVKEKYPEIEALIKMLYIGHTENKILINKAWGGFAVIARQKAAMAVQNVCDQFKKTGTNQ